MVKGTGLGEGGFLRSCVTLGEFPGPWPYKGINLLLGPRGQH